MAKLQKAKKDKETRNGVNELHASKISNKVD
jgi:hypothetical protein